LNNPKINKMTYFTAICFDRNKKPYKYRAIAQKPGSISRFEKFCISRGFVYINYYDRASRSFAYRKYLSEPFTAPK